MSVSTQTQRLLVIGKVWIEPGSSAAGSRTLQLIQAFLQNGWQVSFATTAGDSPYKTDLASIGVSAYTIELNNSGFDDFIKKLKPGLVIFDRFTTEEQFGWRVVEHCPQAMRVLDTIDLHCLRTARQRALKEKREFNKADLFNDVAKRELASIYRCDLSLMISTAEVKLLTDFFKVDQNLLHYVPFMLPKMEESALSGIPGFALRKDFVTIGNFLHEPNWDSVLFLKQEVWPLIRQQLPGVSMLVYGAYPSQKVFELHKPQEGFVIRGRAENVADVMKAAKICLAPLRFGAGMKGKLLDAMIYGTPSVTTPIGAESMHGDLPWNGRIANSAEEFAKAAVQLYKDQTEWESCQKQGIKLINQLFDQELHSKNLVTAIDTIHKNLNSHRLDNFTGSMLMHQSLSATKYMALWIEAKNK